MKRSIAYLLLVGLVTGPSLAQVDNLLVNGGFEDGFLDPWTTYGDVTTEVVQELAGAVVSETPVEGDNALQLVVNSAGGNFWDTGLIQRYPFEQGIVYTLSAFVKAQQGEMQINFKPERGADPWEGYGEQQFTFGEEWTEFSVTTPEMPVALDNGQLTFHIAFSTGTFWMDGVRFYEGEYVEPDFEPGPPLDRPCPLGLGVELDETDVKLNWSNGDIEPNSVDISRNGELIADDAAVVPESYVDEDVAPGAYTYELTFDVPGETCNPVTLDVNTCISGLAAINTDEGVKLSWTNARVYDAILVKVDGEELDEIDGDLEAYTDTEATDGLHTYEVEPVTGICDPASTLLDVQPTKEEGENVLVNGGFEDGVLEPWNTYGTVTVEVVEELEGAAVDEDPIEGSLALRIDVPAAGANFWDAGLQHNPHPLEEGVIYTLSAFLKTQEGELRINYKPERGEAPWEGYGEQQFTFGEEWTEFSVTTPPMPETVPNGSVTFHIAFAPGTFFIDGVRFYEGEYVPPDLDPDPEPEPQGPRFVRGDTNTDGSTNIADAVFVLGFLFSAEGEEPACAEATDTNADGTVNITDGIYLLSFLFSGGEGPPAPYPECGRIDGLPEDQCKSFDPCPQDG